MGRGERGEGMGGNGGVDYPPLSEILSTPPLLHTEMMSYQTICGQTNSWSVKLQTEQYVDVESLAGGRNPQIASSNFFLNCAHVQK